ncbi:23S rRNA (pseudouridine(1915)-N(3))-methyltransferase RlmH [Taklimakanibacter lacteus]|uniref:23S rRNA (pseudouridine(1915)-N(3))-methyltransferase RlmH n=1 Tax=Taklimakanibacter lacteus TaxID=2268456 RepID=UPI000E66919A
MKLHVLAIGRLKAGPELALFDDYAKRARGLGRSCGITALETRDFGESRLPDAAGRMAAEADLLTGACPDPSFTVVLDERGKALSSEDFAGLLRRHLDQGTGSMAFLIGGPDGHGGELRRKAGLLLSLGPMTWPHRLARVMLSEQIYRAVTILVKHPYHRA